MEDLREKANNYAEENVINVLKEAFAKVYADGFREGYKARDEEIPVAFHDDQTEFVDLGLPSGTLWAADYEKEEDTIAYLPYAKAALLNIPTIEQWEELFESCRWECVTPNMSKADSYINEVLCVGPNGNVLRFNRTGMNKVTDDLCDWGEIFFWLADDNEEDCEKNSVRFRRYLHSRVNNVSIYKSDYGTTKLFSGYKLPVRLVQTK